MRLSPGDFRFKFNPGEAGEELELGVRRASLRPNADSLALLRHSISRDLGTGARCIKPMPYQQFARRRTLPLLRIPLSDEHLPDREAVLRRVKAVIGRLAKMLKVVSPRHLKPRRVKMKVHERPLRRRTRLGHGCGGASA